MFAADSGDSRTGAVLQLQMRTLQPENRSVSNRTTLRQVGADLRGTLGLQSSPAHELAPGYDDLAAEVVFGKVWARPGLEREDRMLATLCALTCKQYLPQLERYAGAARNMGMPARSLQEVVLHCAMYAGLPSAENALAALGRVLTARGEPAPETTLEVRELDTLDELGRETMQDLHRERAGDGYAAPDSAASELYATAIQYLYGEIWNRPGLTRRQRMVCSVAAFTALQMASQQRKFFRSALNTGLGAAEVMEIIIQTGPYSGFPPALNALVVAEEVLA